MSSKLKTSPSLKTVAERTLQALEALAFENHYRPGHGPQLAAPTAIADCPVDACAKWRRADLEWRKYLIGHMPT